MLKTYWYLSSYIFNPLKVLKFTNTRRSSLVSIATNVYLNAQYQCRQDQITQPGDNRLCFVITACHDYILKRGLTSNEGRLD